MASKDPSILPANAAELREQLLAATQRFFDIHDIRVKTRKLPVQYPPAIRPSVVTAKGDGGSASKKSESEVLPTTSSLPLYHFITRQKLHMAEQLLRNRSSFITPFNKKTDRRQKASPWVMQEMTDELKKHLTEMSSDFDDREFSGVYVSLHTKPYLVNCEYGNLSRSRFVGWALVELLTTNERCLKALWVHPTLCATSTRLLLQAFIPRILVEALEFATPGCDSVCPWKFFYCWLNDFDLLPRGTWLLLSAPKYLGLSVHCDNLNQDEEEDMDEKTVSSKVAKGQKRCLTTVSTSVKVGHTLGNKGAAPRKKGGSKKKENEEEVHLGHRDADEGSSCPCQHPSRWHDEFDEKLVGCTESYIYRHFDRILKMIPTALDSRLLDDMNALPQENPETQKKERMETEGEMRTAETFGLDDSTIEKLLIRVWGQWRTNRFKRRGLTEHDEDAGRPHGRRRVNGSKQEPGPYPNYCEEEG